MYVIKEILIKITEYTMMPLKRQRQIQNINYKLQSPQINVHILKMTKFINLIIFCIQSKENYKFIRRLCNVNRVINDILMQLSTHCDIEPNMQSWSLHNVILMWYIMWYIMWCPCDTQVIPMWYPSDTHVIVACDKAITWLQMKV